MSLTRKVMNKAELRQAYNAGYRAGAMRPVRVRQRAAAAVAVAVGKMREGKADFAETLAVERRMLARLIRVEAERMDARALDGWVLAHPIVGRVIAGSLLARWDPGSA
jgi:hypothetical protein